MDASSVDARVRLAAFEFLVRQTAAVDDVLPRALLAAGFLFEGTRVPLLGPRGSSSRLSSPRCP
jgi:putative restriction endonuclease